jgi:hypothetical protein
MANNIEFTPVSYDLGTAGEGLQAKNRYGSRK